MNTFPTAAEPPSLRKRLVDQQKTLGVFLVKPDQADEEARPEFQNKPRGFQSHADARG